MGGGRRCWSQIRLQRRYLNYRSISAKLIDPFSVSLEGRWNVVVKQTWDREPKAHSRMPAPSCVCAQSPLCESDRGETKPGREAPQE